MQEAQDIFGVDFDYDEFGKYGVEDYEEEEEEEEEDEYLDEDIDTERPRRPKKQLKKKTTRKSIFEIYEPSELKRGHFTDMDNEVLYNDNNKQRDYWLINCNYRWYYIERNDFYCIYTFVFNKGKKAFFILLLNDYILKSVA